MLAAGLLSQWVAGIARSGTRYRLSRQPRTPRFGGQQRGEAARNLDFWLIARSCRHYRDAVDEPAYGLRKLVITLGQLTIGVVGQSFNRPQILIDRWRVQLDHLWWFGGRCESGLHTISLAAQ